MVVLGSADKVDEPRSLIDSALLRLGDRVMLAVSAKTGSCPVGDAIDDPTRLFVDPDG
jgi:hypothetical protein